MKKFRIRERIKKRLCFYRDRMRRISRKQLCLYLFALAVWTYAGYLIPAKIVFAKTPSLDYRFFFRQTVESVDDLRKGDYVRFDIYTRIVPDCFPCEVTKKIACDEGDTLTIEDGIYYCGNQYLGKAKTKSKKGVKVESFNYEGPVPKHRFFAWGRHKDSYDSRYYGFVEKSRVKEMLVPIF